MDQEDKEGTLLAGHICLGARVHRLGCSCNLQANRLFRIAPLTSYPMDVDDAESNAGTGRIRLSLHKNEAVFAELSYCYPLKLLSPRVHVPRSAIAYMLTYGGGLVSGDRVSVSIDVDSGVSLLLLTQVSTLFVTSFCVSDW